MESLFFVINIIHTKPSQPILFKIIPVKPNDVIDAKDIEVACGCSSMSFVSMPVYENESESITV